MKHSEATLLREAFLQEIETAIRLYEHGERAAACVQYESLSTKVSGDGLLQDDLLLDLYLQTEFLVYEHGSTTVGEVKEILQHARMPRAQ